MEQVDVGIRSFAQFYPYYLQQHQNTTCRRLHFAGTGGVMLTASVAVLTQTWWLLLLLPVLGYGFAWVGHFFFEKNKPAAFGNPWWSLRGDFVMFADIVRGRIRL